MCRNIRTLFNFEPPATDDEIRAASLQFVRKISGYTHPSQANAAAFDRAVDDVAKAARTLLAALVTTAEPRDRGREAEKARARSRAASPAPRGLSSATAAWRPALRWNGGLLSEISMMPGVSRVLRPRGA